MKTKQVARSRGQRCGDIEVAGYLVIELGGYRVTGGAPGLPPGLLVLDLRIPHHRFGSVSDPGINGRLYFPNDVDGFHLQCGKQIVDVFFYPSDYLWNSMFGTDYVHISRLRKS